MYSLDNFDEGLEIIRDFVAQYSDRGLEPREEAIIHGSLRNLTYQVTKESYAILQYTVEYISRNLAPNLWKRLTDAVEKSPIEPKFRVLQNRLWYLVEQIMEQIINIEFNLNSSSPVIPPQPMEGRILLDRYKIEEHLFDRDSGERHFLASDLCLGNKPCLVIQRCQQTHRVRQQFEREAEILSELGHHPQIPQLLAYSEEGQNLYLVYEHIAGQPLTELLEGEPWSESAVISLLKNLLEVLEFIQQSNVVHRNLNPDNIIQTDNGFTLIDFATVKEIRHSERSVSQSTYAEGMSGYMPPEQPTHPTTFASDIYAIGRIAIHALTGINPREIKTFDWSTNNLLWRDLVREAEVSDSLIYIIDRAADFYFLNRYQSATKMLEDLNNLTIA